ncbi:hypothetical protein GEU84_004640 [Fertoebacter nigrum]|uniref:Antifreeze protein n=1 Tax=Fertoeibacter niger TaxID=2656921 RepID=A0A8X8GXJ0_9RHOB|nr:hypothetical protein [Fertoeibacter niger]NUB43663.1 hypothetical protein [Fertoeibacter niger]
MRLATVLALLPGIAIGGAADLLTAQCAAFWLGRDDYAARSAYLDRTPGDLLLARDFRDAAVRLNNGAAAPVDAFIAAERHNMALLTEAMILGDRQSRDLHDRLAARCAGPAKPQP